MGFFDSVSERKQGPLRARVVRLETPRVVSLEGSVDLWPDFAKGEEMLASMTAALLDKGTYLRDRFRIASVLEERGASVSFGSAGVRLDFSAHLLAEDIPEVFEVLGEQLCRPLFDAEEVEKVRARYLGAIRHRKTEPSVLASGALSRHLYPSGHPNRAETLDDEEASLKAISHRSIAAFHERAFRGSDVRVVVAGDVEEGLVMEHLAAAFGSWPAAASGDTAEARRYDDPDASGPGSETIPVVDRANLEVRIGHSLSMRRDHADFEPLMLACHALGGNFSARLMSRIRDERGLTYGIGSGLVGMDVRYSGAWRTTLTLSADRLEEGVAATLDELERFVHDGVTHDEIAEKAETLAGQFLVSLATTAGMAGTLLASMERGESVAQLAAYPDRLRAYDENDANRAVSEWLDPARLFVAVAGSVIPTGRST